MFTDPLNATLFAFGALCALIAGAAMWIAIKSADASDRQEREEFEADIRLQAKLEAAAEIRDEVHDLRSTTEIPGGPETPYDCAMVALARIDAYVHSICEVKDAKD